MKLIKINTDHFVICDSIEATIDDYLISVINNSSIQHGDIFHITGSGFYWGCEKITHSTQPLELLSENGLSGMGFSKVRPLNIFEVKELIGEMAVESDAEEWAWIYNQGENGKEYFKIAKEAYIAAYNQAIEDNNDKKYTEEDLLDAFTWGFMEGTERGDVTDSVNKFSQSLQPKTEWDVEIIDGQLKLK